MGRFIDKLNQLSRAWSPPLGFRARLAAATKPKIQLVACLAQENAEHLAGYVFGADAGLLRISQPGLGSKTLLKISQAVPDIPWGGWLKGGAQELKEIIKASGDFVVFAAADTPLAMLQNDKVDKILEVEASLGEDLLKTINELPVDAVLIAGEEKGDYSLSWQHLILFRRLADLLTKPLLVSVPSEVSSAELRVLWEAGVSGVVMEVTVLPPGRLLELRHLIDKLDFPSPHRREKLPPLLPRLSPESGGAGEEEEEE